MTQVFTGSQVDAITFAHLDLQVALDFISQGTELHDAMKASIDDLESNFPFLTQEADEDE